MMAAAAMVWLLLAVAAACRVPAARARTVVMGILLLLPEIPTGATLGLHVAWSNGLTLSNLAPLLAAPFVVSAWWRGEKLFPQRWPGFAKWELVLLGWGLVTLAPWWLSGEATAGTSLTLLAHAAKLAAFIALGLFCLGPRGHLERGPRILLAVGIGVNAAVGLLQAAGWLGVASPLSQSVAGVRATGLFYDANIYGLLMAWALLWLLDQPQRRWWPLTLLAAANVGLAESRAGYVALAAGLGVLAWQGRRRAVMAGLALCLLLVMVAPARSWARVTAVAQADGSVQDRLASMREAWRQIESHPVLGIGWGRALYLGVDDTAGNGQFQGAQNMPLTVWAETGLIGLVLFLLACAAPLCALWGNRRAALLAGYVGLLAGSLTIDVLWNTRVVALVVALGGWTT